MCILEAIREIETVLIDADYGGGKSGGYRSIIAYRSESKCVFMYCFSKSNKENLDKNEVSEYKDAAGIYLALSEVEIVAALKNGELAEVIYND